MVPSTLIRFACKLTAYVVPFYVSHASDPERVRQVLLAAADKHRDVLPDPAPKRAMLARISPCSFRRDESLSAAVLMRELTIARDARGVKAL
jgi:small-conductance mechanosensitive channel